MIHLTDSTDSGHPEPIRLVALDFGTTTSKAVEASAELIRNAVTGRSELRAIGPMVRFEPVFTPFDGDRIDQVRLECFVDQWLAQKRSENTVGGVIITGLAAKKENANAIAMAVRSRIGGAVVALADDPSQESWLAFMGSCAGLSRAHPERPFINLDIGGGTTNIAFAINGSVLSTGGLWIGARHLHFPRPGVYRLVGSFRFC